MASRPRWRIMVGVAGALARLAARLGYEFIRFLTASVGRGMLQLGAVALGIIALPMALLAFGIYLRLAAVVVIVSVVLGIGIASRARRT